MPLGAACPAPSASLGRGAVAARVADYDLLALPILDSEGRLVGIVTEPDSCATTRELRAARAPATFLPASDFFDDEDVPESAEPEDPEEVEEVVFPGDDEEVVF